MFKLLLLMLVIGFGVYKVINFVFRILFTLSGGKRTAYRNFNTRNNYKQQSKKRRRRASNSDLDIDYVPEEDKKKKKGYGGGDYVDYEEVK